MSFLFLHRTLLLLFLIAGVLLLAAAFEARSVIDASYLAVVAVAGFVLLCAFSLFSWLIVCVVPRTMTARAEKMWGSENLIFCIFLMLLCASHLWYISRPANIAAVKSFVACAEPALEEYYEQTGHYPPTLEDLHLGIPIPSGLSYMPAVAGQEEWGVPTGHHQVYKITFGGIYYMGYGRWDVGGGIWD